MDRKLAAEHTLDGKPAAEVFASSGAGALAKAACEGDRKTIAAELKRGVNPNAEGLWKLTPLVWALHCKNVAGIEDLLAAGADPNVRVPEVADQPTAVVLAAGMRDPKILRALLSHGGDPNAAEADTNGDNTALTAAFLLGVHENIWDNYSMLLSAGADINRVYNDETIVELAILFKRFDKVYDLIEKGYKIRLSNVASDLTAEKLVDLSQESLYWARKVIQQLCSRNIEIPE